MDRSEEQSAFPHQTQGDVDSQPGMTLVQWYAGLAMQGLPASGYMVNAMNRNGLAGLVEKAFMIANEMANV